MLTKSEVVGGIKYVLGEKKKKQIQFLALKTKMAFGMPPYTGLNGLDKAIIARMGELRAGFFIEAGGNDGFSQSNTFYLEKALGWSGLLIEPIPELAALSRRFRACPVQECALGSPEQAGRSLVLSFSDLRSSTKEARTVRWNGIFGANPREAHTTVRTLSDVIAQRGDPPVDLLSLDVEGYEVEVLAGLDLDRHLPRFIAVETNDLTAVSDRLQRHYHVPERLTHHDYLFRRKTRPTVVL